MFLTHPLEKEKGIPLLSVRQGFRKFKMLDAKLCKTDFRWLNLQWIMLPSLNSFSRQKAA